MKHTKPTSKKQGRKEGRGGRNRPTNNQPTNQNFNNVFCFLGGDCFCESLVLEPNGRYDAFAQLKVYCRPLEQRNKRTNKQNKTISKQNKQTCFKQLMHQANMRDAMLRVRGSLCASCASLLLLMLLSASLPLLLAASLIR